ncbi:MAG: hypothetical protein AAFX06_34310 [Planctomycetota bacterium]
MLLALPDAGVAPNPESKMIAATDAAATNDDIQRPRVEDRVSRSLERLGYVGLQVEHAGEGKINIRGTIESKQDRFIVFTAARTTAEVVSVKFLRD